MRSAAVAAALLAHATSTLGHHATSAFLIQSKCCSKRLFSASSTRLDMSMTTSRKDLIRKLLKGIETGDPESVAVVSEDRYIQHNPQTREGGEGLAALFARLSKTNPHVNIVRAFEDGDYVFAHTEYDFSTRRIGFEVFRFEGNHAVEHWDNIQPRKGPNPSGRSMVDGPTESTDLEKTEANRELVRDFVETVYVNKQVDKLSEYANGDDFIQHDPAGVDGIAWIESDLKLVQYETIHRVLAEGSFVLVVTEGSLEGVHSSFYDLFRVEAGKIVEHWDTREAVPPPAEWKNDNGKFALKQEKSDGE